MLNYFALLKKALGNISTMKVNIDVYTKDLDAGLAAFKKAVEEGGTSINLSSSEDYETNKFEYLNLMFEADHTSDAISQLDNGLFSSDRDKLQGLE